MKYFGVPKCPYCGKRVNLIRTWSLKKEGEYKCPRCSGISNIFLSPLIYVMAGLAIFFGTIIYFFHKFVANDVGLKVVVYVAIPFVAFFILSLFTPYLKKPIIKKAPPKRRPNQPINQSRNLQMVGSPTVEMPIVDRKDYLPLPEHSANRLEKTDKPVIETNSSNRRPMPRTRIASINDDISGSEQILAKKRSANPNNPKPLNKGPNGNKDFQVNYQNAELRNTAGRVNRTVVSDESHN